MASPTPGSIIQAVGDASGQRLYGTFDGGRTWSTVLSDAGFGSADLGFTDTTHGVVIAGIPLPGDNGVLGPPTRLWMTSDGGHQWRAAGFPSESPPPCTPSQLRAKGSWQGVQGGSMGGGFYFTNTSASVCSLLGRPRLELSDQSGRALRIAQGGAAFGPEATPTTVVLPVRGTDAAWVQIVWGNWCRPLPGNVTVRVTLPASDTPISVLPDGPNAFTGAPRCDAPNAGSGIGVGVFQPVAPPSTRAPEIPMPPA
jgi:hypothetical protein